MDIYQLNFAGLLGLCAVLFVAQRKPAEQAKPGATKKIDSAEASQWPFLTVFALVMASDWLQVRRRRREAHTSSLTRSLIIKSKFVN